MQPGNAVCRTTDAGNGHWLSRFPRPGGEAPIPLPASRPGPSPAGQAPSGHHRAGLCSKSVPRRPDAAHPIKGDTVISVRHEPQPRAAAACEFPAFTPVTEETGGCQARHRTVPGASARVSQLPRGRLPSGWSFRVGAAVYKAPCICSMRIGPAPGRHRRPGLPEREIPATFGGSQALGAAGGDRLQTARGDVRLKPVVAVGGQWHVGPHTLQTSPSSKNGSHSRPAFAAAKKI